MTQTMPVAPAAELTRKRPPGDPPGDFGPVLAQAAQEPPPTSRSDGARTATAEGADTEAAEASGDAVAVGKPVAVEAVESEPTSTPAPAGSRAATLPEPARTAAGTPAQPVLTETPTETPAAPAVELQPGPAPEQDDPGQAWIKAPPGYEWHDAAVAPTQVAQPETVPTEASAPVAVQAAVEQAPTAQAAAAPVVPAPAPAPTEITPAPVQPEPTSDEGGEPPRDERAAHGRVWHRVEGDIARAVKPQPGAVADPAQPVALDRGPQKQVQAPAQPATATPVPAAPAEPGAPAAAAPTQPVTSTQPVVAPERPEPVAPDAPVRAHARLPQLADTARTVIRIAARDGAAQAHITLHPAELGEVEIRLRYHAGGVSADVLADSRAAAQILQQASSELRRSLEAQGVVVHDLDVRHGGHEERRALHEHRGHGHGHGHKHGHHDPDQTTIDTSSLPLPAGAVDVLA